MMSRLVCKITVVIALLIGLPGMAAPGTLAYQADKPSGSPRDILALGLEG